MSISPLFPQAYLNRRRALFHYTQAGTHKTHPFVVGPVRWLCIDNFNSESVGPICVD